MLTYGLRGEGCTWVWEEHILLPKVASPRRFWLQGPLCACSVHEHAHVGRNHANGMYEYSEGWCIRASRRVELPRKGVV